jgi:HD-GYP domain-containing protein (c-di-GMP phosphodiesterase class II)
MIHKHPLQELRTHEFATNSLYLKTGFLIVSKGQPLLDELFQLFERLNVKNLYTVEKDGLKQLQINKDYNPVNISLLEGSEGELQKTLHDNLGKIRFTKGSRWSSELSQQLKEEGIDTLYSKKSEDNIKSEEEIHLVISEQYAKALERFSNSPSAKTKFKISDQFDTCESVQLDSAGMDALADNLEINVKADKSIALLHDITIRDPNVFRSSSHQSDYVAIHKRCSKSIMDITRELNSNKKPDTGNLKNLIKSLSESMVEDKNLLLNTINSEDFGSDGQYTHLQNVNRCIMGMNIALEMKFSSQQIYELAFGCLLHDLGMEKVSQEILMKKTQLTGRERDEINSHPVHSINMLETMRDIPRVTPLIAYQSHERGDGSGYPRRRKSSTILRYSRINAVADVYCALTTERPYRAAITPHEAMKFIRREAALQRLDLSSVQSLIKAQSMYPVGSWVVLNNNIVAKVVSTHRDMVDRPILRVVFENKKKCKNPFIIDMKEELDKTIIKTIDGRKLKLDLMTGF